MNFENSVIPFLKGSKFSSDLIVNISTSNKLIEREYLLEETVRNKKVIHLGFADHLEIIPDRIKGGSWLHRSIENWASKCIGVDINSLAVDFLKSEYGIQNIYFHDILSKNLLEPIVSEHWDFMVIGEVLEHINNPVSFLQGIRENYGDFVDKIIITVPNAFSIIELRSIWKNQERINSDHRFWFTPYTLAKVVSEAGMQIDNFELCNAYLKHNWVEQFIIKRKPLLNHCIFLVASLK